MRHLLLLLVVVLFANSATSEIVDERLRDDVEIQLAAKQNASEDGPEAMRDEDKFDEAAERRKKRRDDALEIRRIRNANKTHVYQLTSVFIVPSPLGPFDLQRDINRGVIIDSGAPGTLGGLLPIGMNGNVVPPPSIKVLFLQDANGVSPDSQPDYLVQNGIGVLAPQLPLDDVGESIRIAELIANTYRPDVIVGHSRGAAVAMNMNSGTTPTLLLSPTWKTWGAARSVKQKTIILHAPADSVVPFASSEQLRVDSVLPPQRLIAVGHDHRLSDPTSLSVMLRACQSLATN